MRPIENLTAPRDGFFPTATKAKVITLTGRIAKGPTNHWRYISCETNARAYSIPAELQSEVWLAPLYQLVEFQVRNESDEYILGITRMLDDAGIFAGIPGKAGRHVSERVAPGPVSIAAPAFNVQTELKGRR